MVKSTRKALAGVLFLAVSACGFSDVIGFESRPTRVQRLLSSLAADSMTGRSIGTLGSAMAARLIASEFDDAGVGPVERCDSKAVEHGEHCRLGCGWSVGGGAPGGHGGGLGFWFNYPLTNRNGGRHESSYANRPTWLRTTEQLSACGHRVSGKSSGRHDRVRLDPALEFLWEAF